MDSGASANIADAIWELTDGRPYVFVAMPFEKKWQPFFERIQAIVQEVAHLRCIRADEIRAAGFNLLETVHVAIQRSQLVIGEISECNSNVFYELGYAAGVSKKILLLARTAVNAPVDLRGHILIWHGDEQLSDAAFSNELSSQVRQRIDSQIALLRDMLQAERPQPSFIVVSPKYPKDTGSTLGQPRDSRTFGDNQGIVGLLSAFGSIFGENSGVELVSAEHCPSEMPDRDQNLYLIGSSKYNTLVEQVMAMIQPRAEAIWRFDRSTKWDGVGDKPVSLYKTASGKETELAGETKGEDYGIILRGPHPVHKGRMLMVMAGAHSLGTGAACVAATRSQHIRDIQRRVKIAERNQAFWVLVRGKASARDGLLDFDDVVIEGAGSYGMA